MMVVTVMIMMVTMMIVISMVTREKVGNAREQYCL